MTRMLAISLAALFLVGPVWAADRERVEEMDRNGDGVVDGWYYYDEKGSPRRRQVDTNGDGRPDKQIYLVQGREIVLREYDLNFDGKVDKRVLAKWDYAKRLRTYQYMTVELEVDNNYDGVIDDFRKRGEKESDTSRVGVVMNTAFTSLYGSMSVGGDASDVGRETAASEDEVVREAEPWPLRQKADLWELMEENPQAESDR